MQQQQQRQAPQTSQTHGDGNGNCSRRHWNPLIALLLCQALNPVLLLPPLRWCVHCLVPQALAPLTAWLRP
jgi:hypothetical protein